MNDFDAALEPVDPRRRPLTGGERRWLVVVLAVAAALRIAWFVATKGGPPVSWELQGDQFGYYHYGQEIAAGNGYVHYVTGEATAYYPVGYPALLGVLYFVARHTPLTDDLMLLTGIFHIVLSVAAVHLTFVVGRRLLGVSGGLVAAAVLAVWPNILFQVSSVQLETAFIFFTMAALAVIIDHDWRSGLPTRNRLLAFGALLSVSAMIRPFSVLVLAGLGVAALVVAGGVRRGWRPALRTLAWPVLVMVAAFTPWTIRNAVQLDTFAPSSTNMGDGLCLDRSLDATGEFRWAEHDGCVDGRLGEVERNRGNTRLAVEFILEHPGREIVQIGRRARFMFETDTDAVWAVDEINSLDRSGTGNQFSPATRDRLEGLSDAFFLPVLWISIPGLLLAAVRAPRPERWLAATMFAGLLGMPLMLYGNPRFHVPLAPFGALGVAAVATAVAATVVRVRAGEGDAGPPARVDETLLVES